MRRKPQPAPFDGALVIDKPQGKTSHDVVDAIRHLAGFRQVGHLGTLDPLATGVLVFCSAAHAVGSILFWPSQNATPLDFVLALPPIPTIRMARQRVPIQRQPLTPRRWNVLPPNASAASRKCRDFFREKVNGRPAYELARKKKEVELKPVEVELFEFKLTEVDGSVARFLIECSSGTYVRSLAQEMGEKGRLWRASF